MRKIRSLLELPVSPPLIAALCWIASLTLIKCLIGRISFTQILFFWFLFKSVFNFQRPPKDSPSSLKTPLVSIQILLGFVLLAFYYCFFGALSTLPLTNLAAIYLTFPLFIPLILRLWMGKKFNKKLIWGIVIISIGILFTFNSKFGMNNITVFLALLATLLKSVHWVGHRRLKAFEPPFRIWFYESFVSIAGAALLLLSSWKSFNFKLLLLLALAQVLDIAAQRALDSKRSSAPLPLHLKANLFNLAIFMGLTSDLIFFHTFPPFKPLLCVILIYFGLFLTFFKKNILPNPVYQL